MSNGPFMLTLCLAGLMISGQYPESYHNDPASPYDDNSIIGQWVKMGPGGPVSLTFKNNGIVEGDFGNDQTVEIFSEYTIEGDMISFRDKKGVACPEKGLYSIDINNYYAAFDLVEDNCGGRVKATMGFWVRPGFDELLVSLSNEIDRSSDPEKHLYRARMYMAIGKTARARQDFDRYIEHDSTDARVYVNRAGTRFPQDLQGVVLDCNRALELQPDNKNAYFLRGLALYGSGEKKKACDDFYRAIELGFVVLKEAEKEKCSKYWESCELDQ